MFLCFINRYRHDILLQKALVFGMYSSLALGFKLTFKHPRANVVYGGQYLVVRDN
jgi:hypothetical protein